MKTVVMKTVCLLFCMMMSIGVVSAQESKKDPILGTWIYSAPDAPYGYDKGKITIKEVDGKLTGEVTLQGVTSQIPEIKKGDDGAYSYSVYADGYAVLISMIFSDGQLIGSADADGYLMTVVLNREE